MTKWDAWEEKERGITFLEGGITTDLQNNILVTDPENNQIEMYDSEGNFITIWGKKGTGEGEFNNPQGITVDSQGNLYIVDSDNHRIQKFSPNPESSPE